MKTKQQTPPTDIAEKREKFEQNVLAYLQKNGVHKITSPEFQRGMRDGYRDVYKGVNPKTLNRSDRMSYSVMKGQAKAFNQLVYPDPLYRLVRNIFVAIGRTLNAALQAATQSRGIMFNPAVLNNRTQHNRAQRPFMSHQQSDASHDQNQNEKAAAKLNIQEPKTLRKERKVTGKSTRQGMSR